MSIKLKSGYYTTPTVEQVTLLSSVPLNVNNKFTLAVSMDPETGTAKEYINANGEATVKFSFNFSDGNSVFGSATFEYLKLQKCIFKDTQGNLFVVVNTTVHNTTPVGELSPL